MEIAYTQRALEERDYWRKSGNKAVQKKIVKLLEAIIADPYRGIGKPEQLKGDLSNYWSRRITREHRLVYGVDEAKQHITVLSMRFHYNK